jgi:hypothetical protein
VIAARSTVNAVSPTLPPAECPVPGGPGKRQDGARNSFTTASARPALGTRSQVLAHVFAGQAFGDDAAHAHRQRHRPLDELNGHQRREST